jgi:predicted component of type VI protein secretion system
VQAAPVAEAAPVAQAAPVAEAAAPAAEAPPVREAQVRAEPTVAAAPSGGLMLRLETERGSRSTFEVTKSGATIGRGPESTIQLADLSVSRKHAKITYKQGAYWLSDLGSMGGTWIDGAKLAAPRRVATGQTIDIGVCRLTVVSADSAEETPAAKGPTHAA